MSVRFPKLLGVAAVVVAAGTFVVNGFTAATPRPAGTAAAGISGYAASAVEYRSNAANADLIDSVSFRLDSAARSVRVRLAPGGPWYDCTSAGTAVSCDTAGASAADATQLSVAANA